LAEQGGTELVVEVPEALYVETDLVLAQTLVRNLLANALKFARTRVVLRAEARAGSVHFSVTNDGPTLSPEVAARIAADESGPLTASGGLGLRLCREICRAQGLKLEARSTPAIGTEFSFTVKAAVSAPALST
jgi:signal transduction histidine kinase